MWLPRRDRPRPLGAAYICRATARGKTAPTKRGGRVDAGVNTAHHRVERAMITNEVLGWILASVAISEFVEWWLVHSKPEYKRLAASVPCMPAPCTRAAPYGD